MVGERCQPAWGRGPPASRRGSEKLASMKKPAKDGFVLYKARVEAERGGNIGNSCYQGPYEELHR